MLAFRHVRYVWEETLTSILQFTCCEENFMLTEDYGDVDDEEDQVNDVQWTLS